MRNYGNTCVKEEDRLFTSSKLPLFDQFARFDFGSIQRKLEERLYLLATAQMIGNGQQPFAISLAHSSPSLLTMMVIMIFMMIIIFFISTLIFCIRVPLGKTRLHDFFSQIYRPINDPRPNMHVWALQIWSSGVSLKRSHKMQFRRVVLRSIGPSSQKLCPNQIFG